MANVPNAASAPLHDLNLVRQEIPPILLDAISEPYKRPLSIRCADLSRQVNSLTSALGADFDTPDSPLQPSLTKKGSKVALALMHGAAETLLPFNGYLRTLTGAQRHDELVMEAITAGSTRRGYLKGIAETRRCPPPAAPNHALAPRPRPADTGAKPHYAPR